MQPDTMSAPSRQSATPKVDVLAELLKIFSIEELQAICALGIKLKESGWGKLTILFNGVHKKTAEITVSEKLP